MDELGWRDTSRRRSRDRGLWRAPLLVAVAAGSLAAGFWFGGDTTRGMSMSAIAALGVAVLIGDLLGPPNRRQPRILSALVMAGLFSAGWYGGIVELERAFEECVARGETVRAALDRHRAATGDYPESLARLPDGPMPGRRLLRPDLMEYRRADGGYELSFSDAVATMSATHERGFFDRD